VLRRRLNCAVQQKGESEENARLRCRVEKNRVTHLFTQKNPKNNQKKRNKKEGRK